MHFNTGYADRGLALAARLERVFDGAEAVVSPSASCVGMVREHCPSIAPRVFELSELLVGKLGLEDVPMVEELLWRDVLKQALLRPRWLGHPGADERLAKLRVGRSVLDLAAEVSR
jgi:hypothetical protein